MAAQDCFVLNDIPNYSRECVKVLIVVVVSGIGIFVLVPLFDVDNFCRLDTLPFMAAPTEQ